MRSNGKRHELAGYGYAWWTGVGREMLLVLRLVNTRGESKRDGQWEGSRSEGLVSSQSQI